MVLVTGASEISRAIAHTFVKEGCTRLLLGGVNKNDLDIVAEELKAVGSFVQTVVQKLISLVKLKCKILSTPVSKPLGVYITWTLLVNPVLGPMSSKSSFDPLVAVNLKGTWLCQRAQIRQMLKQNAELVPR